MNQFSNQTLFLQWLEPKRFVSFRLLDQHGNIIENESGIETELVLPKIQNCIELLAPGIYKFEGKNSNHNATTPFVVSFFKVNNFQNSVSESISGTKENQMDAETIEKIIADRVSSELLKKEKEKEVEDLKNRVKELEKEIKESTPSNLEHMIGKVMKIAEPFLDSKFKGQNSNQNSNVSGTEINEEEEKISLLLQKLMKNIQLSGNDIITTLEKLANLQPDQLKMFIPLIPKWNYLHQKTQQFIKKNLVI